MDGENRRNKLLQTLNYSHAPLSGEKLATLLGVSRQVIVQDIALLRASNHMILSTNRGYLLYQNQQNIHSRIFMISHTDEEMREELYTIVDCGGVVKNVGVEHEVYGMIQAELNIRSRSDVDAFIKRLQNTKAVPLKALNANLHFHMIEADCEDILDEIEERLKEKGFLYTDL
ncbi:MAG: uncharacterized protein PWP24_430 [Clostridiales bacterium]|nr:uncharacterized protein [Clostridiales bacterium]